MAPKGNSKAAAGRARKEDAANAKAAAANAKAEEAEAAKWEQGAKGRSKADDKASKAAAAAAKKAELDRLKQEDEADLPKTVKAKGGAGGGKAAKSAPAKSAGPPSGLDDAIQSFSASNIDDAIGALSLTGESTAKDKVGAKAGMIDAHPERRFKAAFEAYKEAEMPRIRQERPGLRKQQYENELFEEFKKSPSNPFNQINVSYNASQEEKVAALQKQRDTLAKRLAD
ncbi:DUF1014-domain-containing protein [Jaminaea rosea]|uniref:DUF1014-domain-containing protein n=1 Tax=Jaminaea rosea TaxID=1569628 RepID=A0A316UWB0_9BASI|nr:DUF1014-domain-containing protein [Jaminaea rosea]PWN29088.1 DUF1014-domain-containing protein [Jaminaea rosea]